MSMVGLAVVGDYPRSRGGTLTPPQAQPSQHGLSPLARGNPVALIWSRWITGTIPARAGEPVRALHAFLFTGDYPRSRGGTVGPKYHVRGNEGLSPLARGNPKGIAVVEAIDGTIPARAGEPVRGTTFSSAARDYPRSRGGTPGPLSPPAITQGLSPLARGNLSSKPDDAAPEGTIPARAGEPSTPSESTSGCRDYPRSRGGTRQRARSRGQRQGLSPLARGNRLWN